MAKQEAPLVGEALIKEVCRRIRVARSYWDAHNNAACRGERERALALYNKLTKEEKEQVPQVLRVWLRYRSEKYFGAHRTPPKSRRKAKYSKSV
ncbi:Precorrin-3B methylase [Nostoc sp. FACHB-280]|uniref:Precorrin-3B methylase n=1 Tax=Nostoc sp. FACHB-280 TaxID=2692839 RepID=UPI00168ACDC5|nr:Precorrin-3B methylase [Nostoc sp. FACHB-280]MBD2494071.1 Precorrin-3B methylase [Nostoc sp. FACHB-280]